MLRFFRSEGQQDYNEFRNQRIGLVPLQSDSDKRIRLFSQGFVYHNYFEKVLVFVRFSIRCRVSAVTSK